MILKILLGLDLFIAFVSSIFIVLSMVADLVNTSNPSYFIQSKDLTKELSGHSGARYLAMFIASLCWTIFIMCV